MVRREFDNFMVDGEKLTVHIGLMYRLLLPAASSIQLSSRNLVIGRRCLFFFPASIETRVTRS